MILGTLKQTTPNLGIRFLPLAYQEVSTQKGDQEVAVVLQQKWPQG